MPQSKDETFYDILKVDRRATVTEIVAAYHSARNAFSRDSVATYSLFSPEETQSILGRLDEAFQTLSNLERKRAYDTLLEKKANGQDSSLEFESILDPASPTPTIRPDGTSGVAAPAPKVDSSPITVLETDVVSGPFLKGIREKRGLSVDEVSRVTKIPTKFVVAIESDDGPHLPARVYLQGFVKNMANLYRLDPKQISKAYLAYLDKPKTEPTPATPVPTATTDPSTT